MSSCCGTTQRFSSMVKPFRVHTLVFDLDDTLFAEREYAVSGFIAAGTWAEQNLGLSGFAAAAIGLFNAGVRGTIFDRALADIGAKYSPQVVEKLVAAYRTHSPRLVLLPDAQHALDWARPLFQIALISDGWLEVQRRKVEALGLQSIIPKIILTDSYGREFWKPSVRAFEEVMRLEPGRAPAGFVYIADNPRKDFIAPRALGWRTVRIRHLGSEHASYVAQVHEAADHELTSLMNLPDLFAPAI